MRARFLSSFFFFFFFHPVFFFVVDNALRQIEIERRGVRKRQEMPGLEDACACGGVIAAAPPELEAETTHLS